MSNTILAPISLSEPVRAGRRRFWKQILPVTSIDYDGQRIDFDPKFHMDLAEAFKKGAYDQVPVVFAGEKNEHNMDPRNFGGDVIKMEYRGPGRGQGTWALIEASKDAARLIKQNPKLGVSPRIKQGIEKSDGRFIPRAVNHVLLTMNPRVQGMSPWQAVDLSEDADTEVVDLTAAEYTEGTKMGKTKTRRQPQSQIDLSALSDDEFNDLVVDLAVMARERGVDVDDLEDQVDEADEDLEDEEPQPRRRKSKVKTTKVVERESEDDEEDPELDPDADLSEEDEDEDPNATMRTQFQQMRFDLAERDWQRTRDAYLRDGVPAYLLDLAEPVMAQPDDVTLDLSDEDDALDVKDTITKMLNGVKRIVDLTGEIGHAVDLSEDDEGSEADQLLDEWNNTYPVA